MCAAILRTIELAINECRVGFTVLSRDGKKNYLDKYKNKFTRIRLDEDKG